MIYIFSIFSRLFKVFNRSKPKAEPLEPGKVETETEKLIAKINGAFSDLVEGVKTGKNNVNKSLDLWMETVKKLIGKPISIDQIPPSVRSNLMDYMERKRELDSDLLFLKDCPNGWECNKRRQMRDLKNLVRTRESFKERGDELLNGKLIPTLESLDKKRFADIVWRLDQVIIDLRGGMNGFLNKETDIETKINKILSTTCDFWRAVKDTSDLGRERVMYEGVKVDLSVAADKIESSVQKFCDCVRKYVSEYLIISKSFGNNGDGYDWIEFEERREKIVPKLEGFDKLQKEFFNQNVFFLEELNHGGLEQTSSLN